MYLPLQQALGNHPKLRRLARALSVSRPAAVGHLAYLWWWSQDYAPDGDLSYERYTAEDIADAAMWDGDAYAFVDALKNAGFLDDIDGRLVIHDWDEVGHGGKIVHDRAKDAERKREARRADKESASGGHPSPTSEGHPADIQRTADVYKLKEEKTSKEEENNARARMADEPPVSEPDVVQSISEVTDERPHEMVTRFFAHIGSDVTTLSPAYISKQRAVAKRLLEHGHGIDRVLACAGYRRSQTWRDEPFDLMDIERGIDKWEAAGSPARAAPKANGNGHKPVDSATNAVRFGTRTVRKSTMWEEPA